MIGYGLLLGFVLFLAYAAVRYNGRDEAKGAVGLLTILAIWFLVT